MDNSLNDYVGILEKNLAQNIREDDYSFLDFLHEQRIWKQEEYWKVEFALAKIASSQIYSEAFPPEIVCVVWKIFSFIMASFSWHFDSEDTFRIKNLSDEEIRELRERVINVFEGFMCRNFPNQDIFEVENPLLQNQPKNRS